MRMKAERVSFGEFCLNLDVMAVKVNSANVITDSGKETSHLELSTAKYLIFS